MPLKATNFCTFQVCFEAKGNSYYFIGFSTSMARVLFSSHLQMVSFSLTLGAKGQ